MQTAQKRILCIDNRASSNLAIFLLEQAGYEVRTASSIPEGVQLSQVGRFDLHLLNHLLVDGLEIDSCDKLQETAPRTPILFYSTVLYPYRQVRAIHCRLHAHNVESVSVCEVVKHASRLIEEHLRCNPSSGVEIKREGFSAGPKVIAEAAGPGRR